FAHALVGKHRRPGDIADCVDTFRRRFHALIDLDEAAVGELDAHLLEAGVVDSRSASSSHENLFDFESLLLTGDLDAHGHGSLADFDVTDLGSGDYVNLPFLEASRE